MPEPTMPQIRAELASRFAPPEMRRRGPLDALWRAAVARAAVVAPLWAHAQRPPAEKSAVDRAHDQWSQRMQRYRRVLDRPRVGGRGLPGPAATGLHRVLVTGAGAMDVPDALWPMVLSTHLGRVDADWLVFKADLDRRLNPKPAHDQPAPRSEWTRPLAISVLGTVAGGLLLARLKDES